MSKRIMKNARRRKVERIIKQAADELIEAGEYTLGDAQGFISKLKSKVNKIMTEGRGNVV